MDKNTKQYLINLCIVIIIIIILRFLYIRLNKLEGFTINTVNVVDLLSKQTSNIMNENSSSGFTQVSVIKPWTTKIYNMQSITRQTKDIAIYQPKLIINNKQYCKLGDTLSTNANYVLPNVNQLTLLIKKDGSDIKPPSDYNLIVNFGEETIDSKYYEYESYIDDITKINLITPNLTFFTTVFTTLNTLITNSVTILGSNLVLKIKDESTFNVIVDNIIIPVKTIINTINGTANGKVTVKINSEANSTCQGSSLGNPSDANTCNINPAIFNPKISVINVPACIGGYVQARTTDGMGDSHKYSFDFPVTLNSLQTTDKIEISNKIPVAEAYQLIQSDDITINTYSYNIFELIPIMPTINFISSVCDNITTIYNNENTNTTFLKYLNLITNSNIILTIKTKIELLKKFTISYPNINTFTLVSNPEVKTYYDDILNTITWSETSIIGFIFTVIKSTQIAYKLPFITFRTNNSFNIYRAPIPNTFSDVFEKEKNQPTQIEHFYSFIDDRNASINKISVLNSPTLMMSDINSINFNKFDNNFLSNIPSNNYNINLIHNTTINSTLLNLQNFVNFKTSLSNNILINLPLKIYKPIAPTGYTSLGHIFCNIQSQLSEIRQNDTSGIGTCCVPENCVREIREWNASDKVFEYNKNSTYWALYFNPYIGTFISVNTNALPEGKVCKVVSCVKKCRSVDELKKADECARNYYNLNKTIKNQVINGADLVSDQEEVFYLEKLKAQSDSITRLSTRAQQMQLAIDKADIVNSEMNKNKLQTYVDKQKTNIDLILQRLIKDKNSIETNINIPLDVLNNLLSMIKNNSSLSDADKNKLIAKLIKNKQVSCPEYDLNGLVKKKLVSDVCYGCDSNL